jgi:hypothetical protein
MLAKSNLAIFAHPLEKVKVYDLWRRWMGKPGLFACMAGGKSGCW